jgi:Outer membrane protein beta-barrel domain
MKQFAIGLVMLCLGGAGTAYAQTQPASATPMPAPAGKFSVEFDAGAAFGGKTSSLLEGQAAYRLWPDLDLFVEGGRIQNASSNETAVRAGIINDYLNTQGKGTASVNIKVPTTFGSVGARYYLPQYLGLFHPYAFGAIGIASVKNDVRFSLNGTDITGEIANYGVQLGSDLSGTQTSALLSFGGGATLPWRESLYLDAAVRYYRLFTTPTGINLGSVYLGVGYRF